MTMEDFDKIVSARKHLHFMSGMMLAWDLDSVEIGEPEKDGFWYMLECVKKDLETIENPNATRADTLTTD